MTPPAELTAEQELEAKLFAARQLEDPNQTVTVDWGRAWTDEEDFDQVMRDFGSVLERLGLSEVPVEQVKEIDCENGLEASLPEGGRVSFPEILHRLADAHAGAVDSPNDFRYTARIKYSDELDVVIELRSEEAGRVCNDCGPLRKVTHMSGETTMAPWNGESCEHHQGEWDVLHEYSVYLVRSGHELRPDSYVVGV